ncbi:unnamed protein product [Schistosoma rodhaini]|uniref:Uncharacterized protein n=1 Tax=Schistosoma rodhaini TaxID=6188 RepID=A0AA85G9C5_9TREM|nr:unnamed protein product [Schistosoma rodhaini]
MITMIAFMTTPSPFSFKKSNYSNDNSSIHYFNMVGSLISFIVVSVSLFDMNINLLRRRDRERINEEIVKINKWIIP